jgi:hypothetical protein
VSKLDRGNLSVTDKSKLKKSAEAGLEAKFTLMEPFLGNKPSKDQLKSIYSVTMRIEEFRRSLQAFDMVDVFIVASDYELDEGTGDYKPALGSRPIDLFTSVKEVDIETVKHASAFTTHYGQEFVLENLLWSGAKLLNSCDDRLRQKLEERTIGWPVEHTTGPVYFKILMTTILACSPESLRGLTTLIQTATLKDFDGENVVDFVSFARGTVEHLRNNDALPIDILSIITTALKQCSTPDFVSYITSMYNNKVQGVKECTVDAMLDAAESEYIALTTSNKWQLGTNPAEQESVFFAGKCFDCGRQGHRKGDKSCPGRGKSGGRGRGRRAYRGRGNPGRGREDGRGRGRGRGGGSFIPKDRSPPATGEPHSRTKNNRNEKWCGRCGYWTWGEKAHETQGCPFTPASANVASPEPTNTPDASIGDDFAGLVLHAADF